VIRHDVVEPILLEVDQIYHLACPASPIHYKCGWRGGGGGLRGAGGERARAAVAGRGWGGVSAARVCRGVEPQTDRAAASRKGYGCS